ncbi:MAG: dihydrolipoyl dehydrogenase [Kiritimatiellae bacterium]|nr:dihydrolipoyl dehydrogenase [Kiritimatiellia bacterium]
MPDFDLLVIGAGPGGYPAAVRAARNGLRVALVEAGKLGGVCLNCGCIPTKALAKSAAFVDDGIGYASVHGVRIKNCSFHYSMIVSRKDFIVDKLQKGIDLLLHQHGVEVIQGRASFESANRLRVRTPDAESIVTARNILVATGSVPAFPSFLPRSAPNVMDSKTFLSLMSLPKNLIVLGGGVTGVELAGIALRLGSHVTLVEQREDILPGVDPDARRLVHTLMSEARPLNAATILTGATLEEIRADGQTVSGRVAGREVSGDALLYALGRVPCTAKLNLAAAGVRTDAAGAILTDADGATNVPGVFAAGDVVSGSRLLAHTATAQGLAAVAKICGEASTASEMPPPSVIFAMPEIGQAGLSEAEAVAAGYHVRTGYFPYIACGKALVEDDTSGFVKWIGDADTGAALGAVAAGTHASELIAEAAVVISAGLTLGEVASTIHAHPTLSEMWREAADAFAGRCVNLPPPKPF